MVKSLNKLGQNTVGFTDLIPNKTKPTGHMHAPPRFNFEDIKVDFDQDTHVCTIVMKRKLGRGNALDHNMINQLNRALSAADNSKDIHAIVLKSDLEQHFCLGVDLSSLRTAVESEAGNDSYSRSDNDHIMYAISRLLNRMATLSIPIIAVVEGKQAVGAGATLASVCDHVIATAADPSTGEKGMEYSYPEHLFDQRPLVSLPWLVRRVISHLDELPPEEASRLFTEFRSMLIDQEVKIVDGMPETHGKKLNAEQAKALGLVDDVVQPGEDLQTYLDAAIRNWVEAGRHRARRTYDSNFYYEAPGEPNRMDGYLQQTIEYFNQRPGRKLGIDDPDESVRRWAQDLREQAKVNGSDPLSVLNGYIRIIGDRSQRERLKEQQSRITPDGILASRAITGDDTPPPPPM